MNQTIDYHEKSQIANIIGRLEDSEQELIDMSEWVISTDLSRELERQSAYISKVIETLQQYC